MTFENKRQNAAFKKHRLSKVMLCLITVFTVMLCTVPSVSAASETLTVGVPADRCPVFYRDEDSDEIVGIGADLMRIAADEAGYDVEFAEIDEPSLKEALDNPEYDVVLPFGSAVTSAAGKDTVVSDNLFQTPFTLVTEEDKIVPSLNELRIGMLKSLAGGAETVRQLYPDVKISFYETMDECVKALRDDEVDALLHNSYVWSYVLQKPSYSDLAVQPAAMFSMDFRAGTIDTPEGQAIIERLNEGISKIPDTRRQAVILDYTSRKLYKYELSDYIYEHGVLLLLVGLLIVSLIIIVMLKFRTYRFEQEEKMRRMIDHDPLTGVLSLTGFRKRVEELLRAHPDTPYVLSYNNIKNFKYINESLGMKAGNEFLRFWADISVKNISDELDTFGRIEADHFAVLRHLEGDDQLPKDNEIFFEPIRNYFIDRGKEIRIQICTGVYALTPEDHLQPNVDQMLDYARVAEKRLRNNHKEGIEFYNSEQWKTGKLFAEVTGRLNTALQTGEIQVWYQPQINYETGKIIGAEALCRWDHAERGWIPPCEFIPALEDAGLVYDLDCFVWERVCSDLHRWNERGERRIASVNLSRADLTKDLNVPEHFRDLIKRYDLSPDQLHIEITETAYVENPELLISTTQRFREYGFQVEMDDFGSGYSSLNMLKEVQVDRIKLDLHFLTETGDPDKGRIIIRHIIRMAVSLGMKLIAEGVEKEDQALFLHELGCSEMQGFYYYKPISSEDFEKLDNSLF